MANKNLNAAKSAKKDEFYTQLVDIENELKHYREHFRGKTVLCNCDDPRVSNFFHYFSYNFEQLEPATRTRNATSSVNTTRSVPFGSNTMETIMEIVCPTQKK